MTTTDTDTVPTTLSFNLSKLLWLLLLLKSLVHIGQVIFPTCNSDKPRILLQVEPSFSVSLPPSPNFIFFFYLFPIHKEAKQQAHACVCHKKEKESIIWVVLLFSIWDGMIKSFTYPPHSFYPLSPFLFNYYLLILLLFFLKSTIPYSFGLLLLT